MPNAITTVLAFVFVLGIIIFVHEFGHLIVAKAFGMRVLVFSFGFGKRLWGFKWGDTDCRVSALPLGGYVKLEGEPEDLVTPEAPPGDRGGLEQAEDPSTQVVALADGEMVRVDDPNYFTNRPRWQRFLVYLAGPSMNALLTIVVLSGFYMVGLAVEAYRFDPPIVGAIDPGSPAEKAGLRSGDRVLSIDGKPTASWDEAQYEIVLRPEKALELRIERDGAERRLSVRSEATSAERLGTIGVHPLVRVGEVLAGRPAEAAGVRQDDAILSIDGKPIRSFSDIPVIVRAAKDRPLAFRLWRTAGWSRSRSRRATTVRGRSSVSGPNRGEEVPPLQAVVEALRLTAEMTRQTFEVVVGLITAQISPRMMMGPLGSPRPPVTPRGSGRGLSSGWWP